MPLTVAPVDTVLTLGSPLRAGLGLLVLAAAITVLLISRTIDWGVAWTAVIPALVLLIPAQALLQRCTLSWTDATLTITRGWLWRRALVIATDDTELELLPTAGLMAVVLHRHGRAQPLATFVLPSTARRLARWLDARHPHGAFPRRAVAIPAGDR